MFLFLFIFINNNLFLEWRHTLFLVCIVLVCHKYKNIYVYIYAYVYIYMYMFMAAGRSTKEMEVAQSRPRMLDTTTNCYVKHALPPRSKQDGMARMYVSRRFQQQQLLVSSCRLQSACGSVGMGNPIHICKILQYTVNASSCQPVRLTWAAHVSIYSGASTLSLSVGCCTT